MGKQVYVLLVPRSRYNVGADDKHILPLPVARDFKSKSENLKICLRRWHDWGEGKFVLAHDEAAAPWRALPFFLVDYDFTAANRSDRPPRQFDAIVRCPASRFV